MKQDRTENMKQVIVMRTDLNMRKGKMIAQGAHAVMGVWLHYCTPVVGKDVFHWLANGAKKICVRAKSEEELRKLYMDAKDAGLRAHIVTDAGRTEFNGVPTVTCLAIGPNEDEAVDKITGHLELL